MSVLPKSVFLFADVEVHESELRATRAGQALEIEPKAFRVLVCLVQHAGHLVTKSELMEAVWGETAVTENSLTRAIAVLRRVLEDDPHQPRFIETVSTAGYRFICPVVNEERPNVAGKVSPHIAGGASISGGAQKIPDAQAGASAKPELRSSLRRWRWMLVLAFSVLVVSAVGAWWYARPLLPPPHIAGIVRLTSDPRYDKFLIGADASRIYMNVYPTAFGQVPISGGNVTIIPIEIVQKLRPFNSFPFGRLSPDGSSFLVQGHRDPKDQQSEIWVIGSSGTPVHFLTRAWSAGWSADGKQIIYTTPKGDMFTIPSAGGDPHLIRTLDGSLYPSGFEYSPDGNRIRFNWGDHKLMEMSADGSNLHEILAGWHPDDIKCCGFWTPDGDFFLFLSANSSERRGIPAFQLWAIDERHVFLRKPALGPVQLTFGPMTWETPITTRDGKQVLIKGNDIRGELVRYNRQSRQLEPFLGGISADMLDFSRDGKYVVYASFPGDILWRANRDGTEIQEIAKTIAHPTSPRWSPDASQIAFVDFPVNGPAEVYLVSSQGGTPVRLLPDNQCCDELDPTWSPDGKRLAVRVASPEGQPEKELRIVDLATHQVWYLPQAPKRTWLPRWSPDGRYIVCETNPYPETDGLEVFDFKTRKWKILLSVPVGWPPVDWPSWSKDGRSIYYMGPDDLQRFHRVIFRISVNGGTPERIADLPGFRPAGWLYSWFGVDPDENPIMLRDAGANEIYALKIER